MTVCALHPHYTPECSACVRTDRVNSAYGRAFVDVQEAAKVLAKGISPNGHGMLAKAAESLNAYLAELER